MTQESAYFSDETLTAYLDGELDPTTSRAVDAALETDSMLADRLASLDFPMDKLRQVMSPEALGAPALPASFLPQNETLSDAPQQNVVPLRPARSRFLMPLSLAASFLIGMVATTLIQPLPEQEPVVTAAAPAEPAEPPKIGWTAAVATYQSLYVTETLEGPAQEKSAADAVLARARDEFDVALGPATEIDGATFKRAQMLGFRGKPLLQMAYLRDDGTPFALCLIRTDNADRGIKPVEMFDLAGVSWVKDGVGYFLIGGDDAAQIEDLSTAFIARL